MPDEILTAQHRLGRTASHAALAGCSAPTDSPSACPHPCSHSRSPILGERAQPSAIQSAATPERSRQSVGFFNDMHVLDTKEMEWAAYSSDVSLPTPLSYHSAVAIPSAQSSLSSIVVVFGGQTSDDSYSDEVQIFDTEQRSWTRVESGTDVGGPGARAECSMVCNSTSGGVSLFGGWNRRWPCGGSWRLTPST